MINVSDLLMTKEFWDIKSLAPGATAKRAAQVLLDAGVGALIVKEESDGIAGIVTERDLLRVVAERVPNGGETKVAEIMSRSLITCDPSDPLTAVLRRMNEHHIRHVPVVEGDELVGLLSTREVTNALEVLDFDSCSGMGA